MKTLKNCKMFQFENYEVKKLGFWKYEYWEKL